MTNELLKTTILICLSIAAYSAVMCPCKRILCCSEQIYFISLSIPLLIPIVDRMLYS